MSTFHQNHHSHPSKTGSGKKRQDSTPKATTDQVTQNLEASERAIFDPTTATPKDILHLQNTAGNQAVSGLIQAKLRVGPVGDAYEQEADRVANKVVQSPTSTQAAAIQREAAPEEEEIQMMPAQGQATAVQREAAPEEEELLQMKPAQGQAVAIQREAAPEEEELQMKPASSQAAAKSGFTADEEIEQRLQSLRGNGQPLPKELRSEMEAHLGADFSGVRLHTNSEASQLNRRLAARAFTHGKDIYLDSGEYNPTSREGKRLLAHELTHVVQQSGGVKESNQPASASPNAVQRVGKGQSIEEYQEELLRHPEKLSDKEKQLMAKINTDVDPTKGKPSGIVGALSGFGQKMKENSGVLNPQPLPQRPEQEGLWENERAQQSKLAKSEFHTKQRQKAGQEQRTKNAQMAKYEKMAYDQGIDFEKYQGLNTKAQSKFMESHVKGDTVGAEFAMQGKQKLNWKDKAKFWKFSEYSKEKDTSGKSHWVKGISEDKPKWWDPTSWKTGEKKAGESVFKPWTWGGGGEKKDGEKPVEESTKPDKKSKKTEEPKQEQPVIPSKEDQEKQNEQMTKSMKDVLSAKSSKSEDKEGGSGGGKGGGGGGGADYQIGKDVAKLELKIEQLEKQIEALKK